LAYAPEKHKTPWQKVRDRFGMSPAALAKACGWDRSKLSRAFRDERGLINGVDQETLLKVADARQVNLTADDLVPTRK